MRLRSPLQEVIDTVTFPLRALAFFHRDRWGLSSLATERFDYVAREARGFRLDVCCGRHDRFVREFLGGRGRGIDVFPYEGLATDQVLPDLNRFPFPDASFAAVTFIANLNHVPAPLRDAELAEAWRCLEPGGNIVVTMGNPLSEVLVHWLVGLHDRVLGTRIDVDGERGMGKGEAYYLTDTEITDRLHRAGLRGVTKRSFVTQWGLNHLLVGWKPY